MRENLGRGGVWRRRPRGPAVVRVKASRMLTVLVWTTVVVLCFVSSPARGQVYWFGRTMTSGREVLRPFRAGPPDRFYEITPIGGAFARAGRSPVGILRSTAPNSVFASTVPNPTSRSIVTRNADPLFGEAARSSSSETLVGAPENPCDAVIRLSVSMPPVDPEDPIGGPCGGGNDPQGPETIPEPSCLALLTVAIGLGWVGAKGLRKCAHREVPSRRW